MKVYCIYINTGKWRNTELSLMITDFDIMIYYIMILNIFQIPQVVSSEFIVNIMIVYIYINTFYCFTDPNVYTM